MMRTYKVIITESAKEQLKEYIAYIMREFQNKQAAQALRDDARETKKRLEICAGSLRPLQNPGLNGYRKMHFLKHDFVMLYRIEGNGVYVDRIYHELQDYENKFE